MQANKNKKKKEMKFGVSVNFFCVLLGDEKMDVKWIFNDCLFYTYILFVSYSLIFKMSTLSYDMLILFHLLAALLFMMS